MTAETGLDDFRATLSELSEGELVALAAARATQDPAQITRAWSEVRSAVARLELDDQLRRIEAGIARWAAGGGAGSGVWSGEVPAASLMRSDVRRQAVPAVLDAVAALLLGDTLPEAERAFLLRPWATIARA